MDSDGYITLLDTGLEIATEMYNRHKFLAQFLMAIGVSEEIALADACKIEHDISDESYQCLKNILITSKKCNNLEETAFLIQESCLFIFCLFYILLYNIYYFPRNFISIFLFSVNIHLKISKKT